MSEPAGYIKVWRTIRDHWIWRDPERLRAWLDLLIRASYHPGRVVRGGKLIDVARGQVFTSQQSLARDWGWDRKTVRLFFARLAADQMVAIKTDTHGPTGYTLLTIRNYERWQGNTATDTDTHADTQLDTHAPLDSPLTPHFQEVKKVRREETTASDSLDWLETLNREAGRKFRPTEANLRPIRARIREGHTLTEAEAVVKATVTEWRGTEFEKYLRSATLFGPKFDGYFQACSNGHHAHAEHDDDEEL